MSGDLLTDLPSPLQGTAWVHPLYFPLAPSAHDPIVACVWKHTPSSCEDSICIQDVDILSSTSCRSQYPFLNNMAILYIYPSCLVAQDHIGECFLFIYDLRDMHCCSCPTFKLEDVIFMLIWKEHCIVSICRYFFFSINAESF